MYNIYIIRYFRMFYSVFAFWHHLVIVHTYCMTENILQLHLLCLMEKNQTGLKRHERVLFKAIFIFECSVPLNCAIKSVVWKESDGFIGSVLGYKHDHRHPLSTFLVPYKIFTTKYSQLSAI